MDIHVAGGTLADAVLLTVRGKSVIAHIEEGVPPSDNSEIPAKAHECPVQHRE